jgi:hypothetical protein
MTAYPWRARCSCIARAERQAYSQPFIFVRSRVSPEGRVVVMQLEARTKEGLLVRKRGLAVKPAWACRARVPESAMPVPTYRLPFLRMEREVEVFARMEEGPAGKGRLRAPPLALWGPLPPPLPGG